MDPHRHNNRHTILRLAPALTAVGMLAASCASMGRPEGGPRDETPPVYVRSTPAPGTTDFKGKRLRIYFDENVQINDAMSKVVVSPVQTTPPSIAAIGHYVQVDFRDSMKSDMTYTVDFADAIRDLNEGNVLDGFATDFSTGPTIDTLRISGMVFEAANLEPAQGMIVGVYSNLADSAITTLPFERITKTNQYGRFTLRNLKPGTYRIFAVNDLNRDYHWDRSEDIAFYDSLITPTARRVEVTDTLLNSAGADSLVTRWTTAYSPDDIILTWFNPNYKSQYLVKNERPDRRRINLEFGAQSDTFPTLAIVGAGHLDGLTSDRWAMRTSSATRDTISYWITDTLVSGLDSLTVSLTYLRTDTADALSWTTDTLRLFMRGQNTRAAEAKRMAKEAEQRRKALEKGDTLPEPEEQRLKISVAGKGGSQDVHLPLPIAFDYPVTALDSSGVHLDIMPDSVWMPAKGNIHLSVPQPLNPVALLVEHDWTPGAKYRISIDSMAVKGVYGLTNPTFTHEFTVKKLEDYSTIRFNISPAPTDSSQTLVVELLSKADVPVARVTAANGTALFEHLAPSTYYARAFIDRNANGRYDSGSLPDSIQPEEVFYYPKKLTLKKNWDIEQSWNIYDLPLDLQKPLDIKKNKPARKRGEKGPMTNDEDDEEYDEQDAFGRNYFNETMGNGRNNRNNRNGQYNY